jgi:uncharacterized protein (DUF1330 family)
MQMKYKLALTLVAGVALGAAAIQGLQAQVNPPAYVVVVLRKVNDAAAFKAGVVDKATPAALAAAGGHYIVRTPKVTSFDGPPPERYVIIAFDSAEKAMAWHNSAAQKEIDAARMKSTDSLSFMVEGM